MRGDRTILKLNGDSTDIPANRIMSLPVVDGKIGDRAALDDGLELYFPDGRIVLAEMRFQKYLLPPGGVGQAQVNPRFKVVSDFDRALGRVCATVANADGVGSVTEMRITPQKVISIVTREPVTKSTEAKIPAAADNVSYRILSALDVRFLAKAPAAYSLYDTCVGKQSRVVRK
ncbi:MAG TPA: hypothetical protein VEU47_13235 [Candidatus Cybelea sp.]|nr:hypothetical protein [Candidatus Cybelea sp.]